MSSKNFQWNFLLLSDLEQKVLFLPPIAFRSSAKSKLHSWIGIYFLTSNFASETFATSLTSFERSNWNLLGTREPRDFSNESTSSFYKNQLILNESTYSFYLSHIISYEFTYSFNMNRHISTESTYSFCIIQLISNDWSCADKILFIGTK